MLHAVGTLLPYAVPVALSPLPIIAAVMLLLSPSGIRSGLGFLAGRWIALVVLALVVALLSSRLTDGDSSGDSAGWLRIGLGLAVLAGAGLMWSKRPRGDEPPPLPGWMRSLESMSPARAVSMGMLLTAANVKELAFVIGAGVLIGTEALSPSEAAWVAALFGAIACVSIAAPLVMLIAAPTRSRAVLGSVRDWLVRNNSIVIAIVLAAIGIMLIGDGLQAL
ncbi:MAG: GAP family protein [Rhizobiaceae bacterium]|nr:GAP family protein [Rhizobiaceae bacterium]